ncbi:hypothetical protein ACFO5T_12645 [Dokdonia genika]|uniref:Uncharacterized protein n=1 Tax=Dokdonia genika TaxID=308113 RepID=A0ABV9LBK1_9FLAO
MPLQPKITIINRDPIALTFMLRAMGKEVFLERFRHSLAEYPRFSELYLLIDKNTCWLMSIGQYRDRMLFALRQEEVPMYGWQVTAKLERRRKNK